MHKTKQRKIIFMMYASFMVVILASTAIAMKYEDYVDYVEWGLGLFAALLFVVSLVMILKEKEA